jgi:antibiotic biosynthesis monooxygenase (ABM) superfamily enzyme
MDIILTERSIEAWFYLHARSPWIREEHNLAILSPLYPMYKSLFKQMLHSFELIVWILIICSIFLITFIAYAYECSKSKIPFKIF